MPIPQRSSPSWGAFFLALAGATYCAVLASPLQESLPCPTSGCFLFRDVTLAGISLWWFGTAAFVFLALLCVGRYRVPACAFATLCMVLDCVLLVIMFFTAPCLTCLGAALFFALVFLCLCRPQLNRYQTTASPRRFSPIFLAWGALFVANLGGAASEQMGDWVISGPVDSAIRVYFSPSCPHCRGAVALFADRAAFLPVAEEEGDYQAVANIQAALESGKSITEAMAGAFGEPVPVSPLSYVMLRLRLLRNSGTVRGNGFTMLPLLMINGMPQTGAAPSGSGTPFHPFFGSSGGSALPPELNTFNLGQCGDDIAPCDTMPAGL